MTKEHYDLLIVGNGFDLAHNLPTSYEDFYNILKESTRSAASINELARSVLKYAMEKYGIKMPQTIINKGIFDLVKNGESVADYLPQVREMAQLAKAAGLNIDYFPTNFVIQDGLLWYIDYECNSYTEEWSFENWGVKYWSRTPEFEEYLRNH